MKVVLTGVVQRQQAIACLPQIATGLADLSEKIRDASLQMTPLSPATIAHPGLWTLADELLRLRDELMVEWADLDREFGQQRSEYGDDEPGAAT